MQALRSSLRDHVRSGIVLVLLAAGVPTSANFVTRADDTPAALTVTAGRAVAGTDRSLRIQADPFFESIVDGLLAASPTFSRQYERIAASGPARVSIRMGHGTTCLSAVVASLLVSGAFVRATEPTTEVSHDQSAHEAVALTTSQNLLATDPNAIARFLETARPAPVSAEDKARVLSTLPLEGEVTDFSASARQKLAALNKVLRATGRESVYEIKVINVPQAAIGLHARAVILISESALTLLDADELQALVAHEVGHEYVWTERERSFSLADRSRLKDLELMCDGIAIVMLQRLGMDASRLMTGVQKMTRFNRERFGTANNERDYPTLAQRQAFARAMAARSAERIAEVAVGLGRFGVF